MLLQEAIKKAKEEGRDLPAAAETMVVSIEPDSEELSGEKTPKKKRAPRPKSEKKPKAEKPKKEKKEKPVPKPRPLKPKAAKKKR